MLKNLCTVIGAIVLIGLLFAMIVLSVHYFTNDKDDATLDRLITQSELPRTVEQPIVEETTDIAKDNLGIQEQAITGLTDESVINEAIERTSEITETEITLNELGFDRNNIIYLSIDAINIEFLDDGTITLLNLNEEDKGYSDYIFDLLNIENVILRPIEDNPSSSMNYIKVKDREGNTKSYELLNIIHLSEIVNYLDDIVKSNVLESVQSFPHVPTDEELNAGSMFGN